MFAENKHNYTRKIAAQGVQGNLHGKHPNTGAEQKGMTFMTITIHGYVLACIFLATSTHHLY